MLIRYLFIVFIGFSLIGCEDTGDSSSETSDSGSSTPLISGYSLTGRMLAANNTASDSDINDPNAPYVSNDSSQSAQKIPNPVILGGYVNKPNSGNDGRSKTKGDTDDYFQVDLRKGQTVTLFIANQNLQGNDLDMGLLDLNGKVLNASVGDGDTETITVPIDGIYFIQVQAYEGNSSYVLSIGQDISSQSLNSMTLSSDFVPGEVIVKMQEGNAMSVQSHLSALGMRPYSANQDESLRSVWQLEPEQMSSLASNGAQDLCSRSVSPLKCQTLMTVKKLRKNADIAEASPNYIFKAMRVPNDNYYRYQWHYPIINLPRAWDVTVGDSNVVVAVVDTGVLLKHPDLRGKTVQGYDFISDRNISMDGDGIDANPDDPGDSSSGGSTFHGTHVAGVIGGLSNNTDGIAGIGWNTKIMPVRVLGRGGDGRDYDIEQAILYAAGLANSSGTLPAHRADIINLSLGGPIISSGLKRAITRAYEAGVIVIAAAGNSSTNKAMYPAALPEVIAVSAIDINKKLASYSNYGSYVAVAAPGGDNTPDVNGDGVPDGIISAVGDDQRVKGTIEFTFASSVGTSMATPHISGIIALMKAVNPNVTFQNVKDLLAGGKITEDIGVRGRDDSFGYGLIDAYKSVLSAIELASGTVTQPEPLLAVSHNSLNYGTTISSYTITLSNAGGGNLTVNSIAENSGGFVTIEKVSTNSAGLGDYTISVNRSGLKPGTYTATVTIASNANTIRIPIILQVADTRVTSSATGDAGYHYVLLVKPDSLEAIQQTQAKVVNGVYDFRFTSVQSGTYIIVAGGDVNNDGYICDVGEACGAYLVLSSPTKLEIAGSRSQLDFSTGFNVNFIAKSVSSVNSGEVGHRGFARLELKKVRSGGQ